MAPPATPAIPAIPATMATVLLSFVIILASANAENETTHLKSALDLAKNHATFEFSLEDATYYPSVTSSVKLNENLEEVRTILENESVRGSEENNGTNSDSISESIVITDTTVKNENVTNSMPAKDKRNIFVIPEKLQDILKPENVITSPNFNSKEYNATKVNFVNVNQSRDENSPLNYGISVIISSDILSLQSAVERMDDSKCKNQSLTLLRELVQGKQWALKMFDASAKSPTGLLWGDTFQLGNFDECLSISDSDSDEDSTIEGQYCLARVWLRKELPRSTENKKRFGPRDDIHWALCVPSSCSANQVQEFVRSLLIKASGGGKVQIPDNLCHKKAPTSFNNRDIGFGSFLLGFFGIILACTLYQLYIKNKYKNDTSRTIGLPEEVISSFSIVENLKKIFNTKQENELGLTAIAGIRTFAMTIILLGHAFVFIFSGPVTNTEYYDNVLQKVESTILISNPLLVDTFLLISAFLFCRLYLLELDKRNGKVNILPIYIFRYIRVTPSYFVVIAFYTTLLSKLNSGPLWDSKMAIEKERCLESWWTNILYINNYVNTENICMFQSWYLSVDTQLFFLAPIFIYPLWKWRRFGECLLGLATVIFIAIPFAITYQYELDPTMLPFPKEMTDFTGNHFFKEAYMKTHMRASVYFMGLIFGYILYRIQTSGFKFSRKLLWICWIISIICGVSAVFTVSIFLQSDYVYNALAAAIFSSLHRVAWAMGTGWLLIACATKNGGILNTILSLKFLVPLGRLTYCEYLVNGIIELHAQSTLRNSIYLSAFDLATHSISHIIQTCIGALILCIMFESPIHGFERILLKRIANKYPQTKNDKPGSKSKKIDNIITRK